MMALTAGYEAAAMGRRGRDMATSLPAWGQDQVDGYCNTDCRRANEEHDTSSTIPANGRSMCTVVRHGPEANQG